MIVYMILFIQMDESMLWMHKHDPFQIDGCVHTVDSCIILLCLFRCIIRHMYISEMSYIVSCLIFRSFYSGLPSSLP